MHTLLWSQVTILVFKVYIIPHPPKYTPIHDGWSVMTIIYHSLLKLPHGAVHKTNNYY